MDKVEKRKTRGGGGEAAWRESIGKGKESDREGNKMATKVNKSCVKNKTKDSALSRNTKCDH